MRTIKRLPLDVARHRLCINQTRAVVEALLQRDSGEFVRTPQARCGGQNRSVAQQKYRADKTLIPALEVGFAAYFCSRDCAGDENGHWMSLPFLLLFFLGYAYVGLLSLVQLPKPAFPPRHLRVHQVPLAIPLDLLSPYSHALTHEIALCLRQVTRQDFDPLPTTKPSRYCPSLDAR